MFKVAAHDWRELPAKKSAWAFSELSLGRKPFGLGDSWERPPPHSSDSSSLLGFRWFSSPLHLLLGRDEFGSGPRAMTLQGRAWPRCVSIVTALGRPPPTQRGNPSSLLLCSGWPVPWASAGSWLDGFYGHHPLVWTPGVGTGMMGLRARRLVGRSTYGLAGAGSLAGPHARGSVPPTAAGLARPHRAPGQGELV